jgi:hypothetical protein
LIVECLFGVAIVAAVLAIVIAAGLAYRYKTSGSYNVQKAAKVGSTAFR